MLVRVCAVLIRIDLTMTSRVVRERTVRWWPEWVVWVVQFADPFESLRVKVQGIQQGRQLPTCGR